MVFIEPVYVLTPFQRWTLLHLHNSDSSSSGLDILKSCCITAMTDNFQKRDAVDGLARLEKMGLIRKASSSHRNSLPADPELAELYTITGDGIIYTKKMLKPVLDMLSDTTKAEKMAQRLSDGKTKSWLHSLLKSSTGLVQQQILERIISFGLGNIMGLGQLLEVLRKNLPSQS